MNSIEEGWSSIQKMNVKISNDITNNFIEWQNGDKRKKSVAIKKLFSIIALNILLSFSVEFTLKIFFAILIAPSYRFKGLYLSVINLIFSLLALGLFFEPNKNLLKIRCVDRSELYGINWLGKTALLVIFYASFSMISIIKLFLISFSNRFLIKKYLVGSILYTITGNVTLLFLLIEAFSMFKSIVKFKYPSETIEKISFIINWVYFIIILMLLFSVSIPLGAFFYAQCINWIKQSNLLVFTKGAILSV
ncbi:hypothetical protein NEPAR06_1442 [Nematocida parisii]|uniref:Uncharacterized protein n=1 Tax=Nematocida parisii (strain ERTm3) TaxID=935791 RepID=I3EEG6_NEMP3|nr:uncharacterized protein NEPG_02240 [Nematocida parisii ERTm1]EIJ87613.1 hypothetical protein NEQG_02160 [Nematocida parisii ERTm3]KAI5126692.1 hypothetical protein NEPAR03_0613 [Nematocida parisii]EIJ92841.1 hypothetical protein NEPG_02240 [Nematocida parisii ERTm1]KAI5129294.1 hypothetical protein NEPAR08_1538 [Nematocida parisii]KAI5142036.1 hypothetical protein NEPAR04_1392 [Nematocida parisii]|eukprot:XP_013060067.1 hypothetical protein NEPG_02240 [Nematocida parisii ERTm1]